MPGSPFANFSGVPFDWATRNPQRVKKAAVDYYTGTLYVYSQDAMDMLWALRAIVNVTPIGNGTQRVYVDSWEPVASIQHTLSMYRYGPDADNTYAESHVAILTDLNRDERILAPASGPNLPFNLLFSLKAEFLLLS